jgi:TonB-linked SusC/RagA family outer membrane protein
MRQYNELLKGWLFSSLMLLLAAAGAQAQQITVHGTVKDAQTGKTLPGVNILTVGTSTGTATSTDGTYKLTVPSPNDTLRFSFIGYQTKIVPIKGRSVINVSLKTSIFSGKQMVVVGYLQEERKNNVGSVTQITPEQIQKSNTNSVTDMLKGEAAGVYVSRSSGEPGSTPTVLIGGVGSISGGTNPLYVIDGVIGSYKSVNPQDVKSINVLKGPVATSIYGARGSNGVIIITTKSGGHGKAHFNFNMSAGVANALKGNLHFMNAQQYVDYYKAMDHAPPVSPDTMGDTNWWNEMFRPTMIQKYNVSVAGGTKKSSYYISGNYYGNGGTLIDNSYERFSGRVNFKHTFSGKFTVGTRLYGNFVKMKNPDTGHFIQAAYQALPWDKPFNSDGTPRKPVLGKDWLSRDVQNPFYARQFDFNHDRDNDFAIDVRLSYNITKFLTLSSTNHGKFDKALSEQYQDPRTIDGSGDNGILTNSVNFSNDFETSNLLTYKQSFNHNNINAVVGFEFQKSYGSNFSAVGTGIEDFKILDLAANPHSVGGGKFNFAFVSEFLQARYNYNERYFLTGSFRRDGSSRFGSNNRYGNFYAVGAAWNVANEPFFHPGVVNQLEIRFGFGVSGNADIGNYVSKDLQSYNIKYNGEGASFPANLGNNNLTWEKQYEYSLGIGLKLFNSRFNLDFSAYQKKNKDLLQGVPLPYQSGFSSQFQNIGTIRNRGIEATISTINVRSNGFEWTTKLNGTYNKNRVIDLFANQPIILPDDRIIQEGEPIYAWYLARWAGVNPQNGAPQWERVVEGNNGTSRKIESTSNFNESSLRLDGPSIPKWYGGFTNRFSYKGVSLSVLFSYLGGYKIYSQMLSFFNSDGRYTTLNQLDLSKYPGLTRWNKPGDHATEPKLVFGGNDNSDANSTRYLENGNHLRLQDLRLSYQIPVEITNKIGFENIKIFFDGGNLWTLTAPGYIGPDPEEGLSGFEARHEKYPNSRTYMFGINLKF